MLCGCLSGYIINPCADKQALLHRERHEKRAQKNRENMIFTAKKRCAESPAFRHTYLAVRYNVLLIH